MERSEGKQPTSMSGWYNAKDGLKQDPYARIVVKANMQQILEMRDGENVTHDYEICVSGKLRQDQQFSAQRAVAPRKRTPKY